MRASWLFSSSLCPGTVTLKACKCPPMPPSLPPPPTSVNLRVLQTALLNSFHWILFSDSFWICCEGLYLKCNSNVRRPHQQLNYKWGPMSTSIISKLPFFPQPAPQRLCLPFPWLFHPKELLLISLVGRIMAPWRCPRPNPQNLRICYLKRKKRFCSCNSG